MIARLAFAAMLSALAASAAAAMDCPLARQPYSIRSPMLDIMLDPRAKAAMDQAAPDLVSSLTRNFGGGDLPRGFAAITTPEFYLELRPDGAALGRRIDAALSKVRITKAAMLSRCARYDEAPPRLPKVIKRPAVLVFEKINGFRDDPSVNAAHAALEAMAKRRGWTMLFSSNGAVFNRRQLGRFDTIVWNNVSGDALTIPQRAAFRSWIEHGGGFAGIHGSGGDPVWFWNWYVDTLVGARFIGHPMNPQFQTAKVVVADPGRGITKGLPAMWNMNEEWYSFAKSPRLSGAHILATLDEKSYSPVGFLGHTDLRMGDHPIAWSKCVGNGRSFYTAIGHRPENYSEPNSVRLIEQGIAWSAGLGSSRCVNGREVGETN